MSNMLPIVEELADCQTHAERADWLMACSYGVIHREHMNIRRILQAARLVEGIAYLEAVLSMTNARRLRDGSVPITIRTSVNMAEVDLKIAARKGAAG